MCEACQRLHHDNLGQAGRCTNFGFGSRKDGVDYTTLGELELARRIEEAGTLAGISRSSFHRIDPQTPRRIDRSVYREMPTRVSLRQVTLRQVVNLLYNLAAGTRRRLQRVMCFAAVMIRRRQSLKDAGS